MSRYDGVLRRLDLGSGGFALDLDGGGRVTLTGRVPDGLVGKAVTVEGRPAAGAFGFLMTGDPPIEVTAVRAR